jgi:REP element-mobilizing transposase RayT
VEIVEDHVRIFLEAPPRLLPSHVLPTLKGMSARENFDVAGFGGNYRVGVFGAIAT